MRMQILPFILDLHFLLARMVGGMILPKSQHIKSYKCSINDISKSNLNPNTKLFIYMGDNRPVDLLVKRVGIPKYIGNATSHITPPLFNVLPLLSPNDDCVFVAIFATSLLLSVLTIGHVVSSITLDNEYNYIYPNFTSSDINVNESIGPVVKDVDISVLSTIRNTNPNNVVIGLLKMNSFSSKYDTIKLVIQGKIDVMVIVETKLDDSYPKIMLSIAHGKRFLMVFLRVPYWAHYYLIFL